MNQPPVAGIQADDMSKTMTLLALAAFGLGLTLGAQGCDRPTPDGEVCGDTLCGAGQVCCNPLAGICTAPGDFCAQ